MERGREVVKKSLFEQGDLIRARICRRGEVCNWYGGQLAEKQRSADIGWASALLQLFNFQVSGHGGSGTSRSAMLQFFPQNVLQDTAVFEILNFDRGV